MENLNKIHILKEKILEYYKKGMPFSDISDTSVSTLERFAEHACYLRQEIEWCRELPEDIFLENVAAYRINNEKIVDCRRWFYDMVYERIKEKPLAEAIMEVNMWCAQSASYHLADDRTANAVTVYKSGYGRCGEESVFAVTVLRSVGIAARQVYAPLWSHCDDNHAWVEVWCEGKWQYLGACEPEAVLNRGWFDVPASRAMLVHARVFGTVQGPGVISSEGSTTYINVTHHYAETAKVTLRMTADGNILKNVPVQLEILNYSSYSPIATLQTDQDGIVSIRLGLGDICISCIYQGNYRYGFVRINGEGLITIPLEKPVEEVYQEYEFIAPAAGTAPLLSNQKVLLQDVEQHLKRAKESRQQRLDSYYNKERAAKIPEAEGLLKRAAGNFEQVICFLEKDDNPYRLRMLKVLSKKDLYDLEADILEEHLQYSMKYKEQYKEDIWVKYVLNPRVEYEELSNYRKEILSFFTEEEKRLLSKEPLHIWDRICIKIKEAVQNDYHTLRVSPVGALQYGKVNEASRKILFVAICRSLGIASRLHPVSGEPQYYAEGEFITCKTIPESKTNNKNDKNSKCMDNSKCRKDQDNKENDIEMSSLNIRFEYGADWNYRAQWSLSVWEKGNWSLQELTQTPIKKGKMVLQIPPGFYRFITSFRTDRGDQLVREYFVKADSCERKEIYLQRHTMAGNQIGKAVQLPELTICKQGKDIDISDLCDGHKRILIWLEEGKEPSEHILNEMLERIEIVRKMQQRIFMIVKEPMRAGGTLEKVIKHLNNYQLYTSNDWALLCELARLMEVESDKYPLAVICDEEGRGVFSTSGYHVGAINLLLERM